MSAAGPRLWNSLPVQLCNRDITYGLFRWQLKGHLFGNHGYRTLWRLICSAKKTFTYSLWTLSSENVWIKITMDRICTIYTAELLWDLSNSVPLLWCYCRNYFPSNVSPIVTMNCVLMQRGSASMVNFTGAGPVSLSFSLIGFEWSPTVSTVRESTLHTSKIVTMLTDVISLKLLLCVVIL